MRKFLNILYTIEKVIACTALSAIILVNIVNVIMRYLPNISPIVGAEDLTQLFFSWLIFVGASCAYGEGMHYGMDLVVDKMHGKMKKIWQLAIKILILAATMFLMVQAYKLMISVSAKVTGAMRISYLYIDMAPFVGFVFMFIHGVDLIVQGIKNFNKEDDGPKKIAGEEVTE